MTPAQYAILGSAAAFLAVLYGGPVLYRWVTTKANGVKWPAASRPPRGTADYVEEIRERMSGVSDDKILNVLGSGATPDEASQAAVRHFRGVSK